MRRRFLAIAAALAGCGDNSRACGPGTVNVDGYCTPMDCGPGTTFDVNANQCVPDGPVLCSNGTKFDPATQTCIVDPDDCQDGTVLVNGACVDPDGNLPIDLEEGPEPNGLGVIENSSNPAGTITLKAIGGPGFVIHGKIDPFQDANADGQPDPDVDSYELTVTAPTLIHITADGTNGVDAGFVSVTEVGGGDPLAAWVRFGIDVTGASSKRQLFLPRAGTYVLAIADTRTLFQYATGGPIEAAPGGDNGYYFITIDQVAIPQPSPIAIAAHAGTQVGALGEDPLFYTAPLDSGFCDLQVSMPQLQALPALDVLDNGAFRQTGAGDVNTGSPAEIAAGGFTPTDTPLLVVDDVYNFAIDPAPFMLTIATTTATALPSDGTSASEPAATAPPQQPSDLLGENQFYIDTQVDQPIDLAVAWNRPVAGDLVDGDFNRIARFTGYGTTTWNAFTGMLRTHAPGRYYFIVYAPGATGGATLTATSTYELPAPLAITEGVQTAPIQVGAFDAAALSYDKGSDPWQQFASASSDAGNVTLRFYDPAAAIGRLDPLTTSAGSVAPDVAPLFGHALAPDGTPQGRILIDDPQTSFFIAAHAANTVPSDSYALTFAPKSYIDFGVIHAGDAAVDEPNNSLAAGGTAYFLVETDDGANLVKLVGTPSGTDIAIHALAPDESVATTVDAGPGVETAVLPTQLGKWTAIAVTGTTAGTFDLSAVVAPETGYTQAAASTTFTSICSAATQVPMVPDASGFDPGDGSDEGLSAPLALPPGFTFFGAQVGQIQLSSNGWASLQTDQTLAAFENIDMPGATQPNALIAPYWTDLAGIEVCARTVGSVMTIEWDGTTFGGAQTVAIQLQLDGATGAITMLYGPAMTDNGGDATVGIEDFGGEAASKVEFATAGSIDPGKVFRFTPN